MSATTTLTPMQIATRRHRDADMLRAGTYARVEDDGWHGCSVGCLAHDLEPSWDHYEIAVRGHALVAETYGYPEWLARLQETVFEGLPRDARPNWHVDLADAIAERGRDWGTILHAIHAAILRLSLRTAGEAADAVQTVLTLHERAAAGEPIAAVDWSAARSAAEATERSTSRLSERSAAEAAAESADSTAWSVGSAELAARLAVRSAWSAVWLAAEAVAELAARLVAWSAAEAAWPAAYQKIAMATLSEIRRTA